MPAQGSRVTVGSQAPDFELEAIEGRVRLSDYRGRDAVLLVFMRAYG
jgi:peroxiredoxin